MRNDRFGGPFGKLRNTRTATYYTAILQFQTIEADFHYMVKQGKNYVQEGDTGFWSIPGTSVFVTLPLGEVDPNGIGVTQALTLGKFTDVNRQIAQKFLNANIGSELDLCQARFDVRVSDQDGNTHVTVVSAMVREVNSTPAGPILPLVR